MDSENKQSYLNKFDEFLSQYKLPLGLGLVGLVLLIGGAFSSGLVYKTFVRSTTNGSNFTRTSVPTALTVKVDISGQVVSPGVYTLKADARVEDAIKSAGGVTETADPVFITKTLNLAQKVSDGMKIYVPSSGETNSSGGGVVAGESATAKVVNVNTASLSELDSLSGVGEVTAQKIVEGRPYQSIEELYTKKSVSRSVYEKIKDKVSVY